MAKRKLVINSATCDMRKISEKILETYEEITVNAANIIISPAASERMADYQVKLNAASVLNVSEEAALKSVNGTMTLKAGEIDRPTLLLVNGRLELEDGAGESLKNIERLQVNGQLIYPSSLEKCMPPLQLNGEAQVYPSGAIRMKPDGVVDSVFLLRAKQANYYAEHHVLMLDQKLDIASLIHKGVHFLTPRAYIASSLLRDAIHLFDDNVSITELPDGCALVEGDVELTDRIIRRCGSRLFLTGSLFIHKNGTEALKALEYVHVLGETNISDPAHAEMLGQIEYLGAEPKLIKGVQFRDRKSITIDKEMLERNQEGICVSDCGIVVLDEAITSEQIEELLQFEDCGIIRCSAGQKSAAEQVSRDVGFIGDEGENPENPLKKIFRDIADPDTKTVCAAEYTF